MVDLIFRPLFTIEVLHRYYQDGICPDLTFQPNGETSSALRNLRLVYKQRNDLNFLVNRGGENVLVRRRDNTLLTGIQVTEAKNNNITVYKPFHSLTADFKLAFFILSNNPVFNNFTNLPGPGSYKTVLYFSNRSNNANNGKNFLSGRMPVFAGGASYNPGDMVLKGISGSVYESLGYGKNDINDPKSWRIVDADRYVGVDDAIEVRPFVSSYDVSSLKNVPVSFKIFAYDPVKKDFLLPVLTTQLNLPVGSSSFTLDLSSLKQGKYKLVVGKEKGKFIYVGDEAANSGALGIAEIFNDASIAGSYSLLDTNNNVNSPAYTISFMNRSTIWQYFLSGKGNNVIVDNKGVYSFDSNGPPTRSMLPIPLSEAPLDLQLKNNGNTIYLPSPGPARIGSIKLNNGVYNSSDIYVNY